MARLHKDWIVRRHGPVEHIGEDILAVEGEIRTPFGRFPRRMTIVRLNSGRTVVFSAIALRDHEMRQIEEFGSPAFLVVPNGFHRLDAGAWKQRYPELKVICPPGARKRVEQAVSVDATVDILGDGSTHFVIVPGMAGAEGALSVNRDGETTLVLNDVISNIRHPKGPIASIVARLFAFGVKRPQIAREVRWFLVKDKAALAAQFRLWADDPHLRRLIVSHGDIIDTAPAEVLRAVAATLN